MSTENTAQMLETLADTANIAETLAREMKAPVEVMHCHEIPNIHRVALPPGWSIAERDDEKLDLLPRRKKAAVTLDDTDGFIDYIKRHGSINNCTLWCQADFSEGKIRFLSILNDHGEDSTEPDWRDHTAAFSPRFSEEWKTWTGMHKKTFRQAEFAEFIEQNLPDIAGKEGFPSGAQMLEMAINFEANQDMRFKSSMRLQSGAVQFNFVQSDDNQTIAKMQMFERFAIGIPVFLNGDAYLIDARLRYRVREGVLTFWYELIRPDKTLEATTRDMIKIIREKTGNPFFFGNPFAK
ncbi:MAG: YfdQ family protein [Betaproteobacteria bacterium]|nr:YfdQ family protein [Betaproteobacteria bacterium]